MADQNTVPNSGVVPMPSSYNGPENEGQVSLGSAGSGHPRGVNEAGTPIPTGYEGQANGVRMPAPMQEDGYETWPFNDDGEDMSGVQSAPPYIHGVQLPGVPAYESGWSYGQNFNGLAMRQTEPPTNQQFGVFEQQGIPDGDDEFETHVVGRMPGNNYDMVQTGDIMPAFAALSSDGGTGAAVPNGPVPGYDSMNGIVLGPGSGPYTGGSAPYQGGGEQDTYSTGNMQ